MSPHRHPDDDAGGHGHGHGHGHGREETTVLGRFRNLLRGHSHDATAAVDSAMATRDGMRALAVSFAVLVATALVQAVVVVLTGSSALLADCLHNIADALTSVPLAIAFLLARRGTTRRYTYGFGRAEDLAGIVVVALIAASAVAAAVVSIRDLDDPDPVDNLTAVCAAAAVGFFGNEWVARYRIRVGRRIGSAALVADGLHARTDGFTSLAVLVGAAGVAAGVPAADPIVGLAIAVAICVVLREAAREIYRRLMDAVDPALLDRAEEGLRSVPGVLGLGEVRMRWIGHELRAEAEITVDGTVTLAEAHRICVNAEHELLHAIPRLVAATVHADPHTAAGAAHHSRWAP
jgi:cation diffusion facilitator family transporter